MTSLVVFGLISFIIQIYVLKHTYTQTSKGDFLFVWEKAEKIGIPIWLLIVMFMWSIIPIASIVETIIFWVIWLKHYANADDCYNWKYYTYWRFKDNFFFKKDMRKI